jgi:hypothetical protein
MSFSSLFRHMPLTIPNQTTTSTSTHQLTERSYLPYSGTCLLFEEFNITEIAAGFSYEGAKQFFQEYSPVTDDPMAISMWWNPVMIGRYQIQLSTIDSEGDSLKIFIPLVLRRAIPAAMCLWGHLTGRSGGAHPFTFDAGCFRIIDTSSMGVTGQIDRSIQYRSAENWITFAGAEVKMQQACKAGQSDDILTLLSPWLGSTEILFTWDTAGHPVYNLPWEDTWCKKARKMLLQVSTCLITNSCS